MTDPAHERAQSIGSQRLDKWLWFARVAKTRSLAGRLVSAGKVRINRIKCNKPAQRLRCGDVVTAIVGRNVRVLKVLAAGRRRGPATEAAQLFDDLTPQVSSPRAETTITAAGTAAGGIVFGRREPGSGRPTKRERRQLDRARAYRQSGDA